MWQALSDLLVVHHPNWPSQNREEDPASPSIELLSAETAFHRVAASHQAASSPWSPCFGGLRESDRTLQPTLCSRRLDFSEPVAAPVAQQLAHWLHAPPAQLQPPRFGGDDSAGAAFSAGECEESDGAPSFGGGKMNFGSADQASGQLSVGALEEQKQTNNNNSNN
ncbi:unnamed protein product [Polarella glacialis]|uniref:Uncharacterized protein n=1 Tax=Polarella glacialis TaxID=89957 RepID=A0A813K6B3_POLGL|nr:unnamed protein product [Polarella glacialis]CAE8693698.1 unnamed protein product [Polarella glacialis]